MYIKRPKKGDKGCYGTFHAQSAREAVARLKNLGIMEMDLEAIDLILTQKRWSLYSNGIQSEERKLIEICEPVVEKNKLSVRTIFEFDFDKEKFRKKNESKRVAEKISRTFKLKKQKLKNEINSRIEFLASLKGKNQVEFFSEIQNYKN